MFGVGGGFLMTPLLFFIGIPPAVAVATEANQIVASSFSGVLAHLKRKSVDLRMGTVLLIGGLVGAALPQHPGQSQHGGDQQQYGDEIDHEGPQGCFCCIQTTRLPGWQALAAAVSGAISMPLTRVHEAGNKGVPGRSRGAICLQHGATVVRLSIRTPFFTRGLRGDH
jgi:hypothetical protein